MALASICRDSLKIPPRDSQRDSIVDILCIDFINS